MADAQHCPVCGSEMGIDYQGDIKVPDCPTCGWPTPFPASADHYRVLYESLGRKPTAAELRDAVKRGEL